jgi:nitrite reductase (NADH) large subunit
MRLIVIGNGMAGVAAVEEVRSLSSEIAITIFGDEPYPNYNRILLSDVLAGKQSKEGIILNPLDWYAKRRIDLNLGVRVNAICPDKKKVIDEKGVFTPYDRLLLAMGGRPFIPQMKGSEREGVFVFRTLQDCDAIMEASRTKKEAVVIGGGLLGLEAARGLINHGVRVTVVHLADWLMEQQLDPTGGGLLKREMERLGIQILVGASAVELLGNRAVEGVKLSDGRTLPAQMVLVCAGYRPSVELAQAAGLSVNRGVVVNDRMETSDPNVFAVGDLVEHRGRVYGLVAPIRDQAKVAADAIAGKGTLRYEGTTCATVLKVAGVNLTSAGAFRGERVSEELVYLDTHAGIYKKLVLQGNRIIGMILLGDNREGQRLFNLLKSGEDVSALKDRLIAQGSAAIDPSLGGASSLSDADLVCNCHTITKGAILCAIREKRLKDRAGVAAATGASTGCGSCASLVEDLVKEAAKGTVPSQKPATVEAGIPPPRPEPITVGVPLAYPKVFDAERIKREGLGLDWEKIGERGALALAEDDYYRLKSYGVCSQKHAGYFMVRVRIPGGDLTWRQLLLLADLAETHGRGSGHLTTRQDLELHWVRVEEVPEIWKRLEAAGLSTRSACGHTLRNVACCPHSAISPDSPFDVQPIAKAITDHFIDRSDLINPTMPNRLNIYFAGCGPCASESRINDLGFVPVRRSGNDPIGFEVWVGGSLGSHPILGYKIRDRLPVEETLAAVQAIFQLHIQYGNRGKGRSRLKYLIERWGREKFTEQFERVFKEKLALPENRAFQRQFETLKEKNREGGKWFRWPIHPRRSSTMLPPGVSRQRQNGYLRLDVEVPLGEIRSDQLRTLGEICRRYGKGQAYLTRGQNVEVHWVARRNVGKVLRWLGRAGLSLKGPVPRVVACPGTEFCVLAVTNAQGAARGILKHLRDDPTKRELLSGLSVHISGCPNSCAKHQVADIGLAGAMSAVGDERRFSYFLYLGGSAEGEIRIGEVARKGITEEMVAPTVDALLSVVAEHRRKGESFGEVVRRVGAKEIDHDLEERLAPHLPHAIPRLSLALEGEKEGLGVV